MAPPNFLPNGFLPGDGQRQVHPLQRHPVNQALPVFPLPPGHGVTEGAVIQEETLRDQRPSHNRLLYKGLGRWKHHRRIGIPGNRGGAVFAQVAVQAHRHGAGAAAFDDQRCPFGVEAVAFCAVLDFLELNLVCGSNAPGKFLGRPLRGAAASGEECEEK